MVIVPIEFQATKTTHGLPLSDGRRWGRYVTVSSNGDKTIYQIQYLGHSACDNGDCPYFRKYGKCNSAHFENINCDYLCRECGTIISNTMCRAKKTNLLSPNDPGYITICHTGTRVCSPTKKVALCKEEINELVKLFPNIKLAVAANTIIKRAVISGSPLNEIGKIAESLFWQKRNSTSQIQQQKSSGSTWNKF